LIFRGTPHKISPWGKVPAGGVPLRCTDPEELDKATIKENMRKQEKVGTNETLS